MAGQKGPDKARQDVRLEDDLFGFVESVHQLACALSGEFAEHPKIWNACTAVEARANRLSLHLINRKSQRPER